MKREDEEIWEEAKKDAKSASAAWDLETARINFVAEYAERKWFEAKCHRLGMIVRSLCGRIGALKKRIAALEKGGGK